MTQQARATKGQTQLPQKRKAAPSDTTESNKKTEVNFPSGSGVSLRAQLNNALSRKFDDYGQEFIFKKAGFQALEGSSARDDMNSFLMYSDDSDVSIQSEPSSRNRTRRNRRQHDKEDEDEAYIWRSDSDSEVEEFSISKSEKSTFEFDYSAEKARRWSGVVNLPQGIWSEEERDLFFRLAMRGFEPLIPKYWHLDFPTLPESLFAEVGHEGEAVIHAIKSEFHAIKSLVGLFNISGRVRDCRILRIRPETVIKRAIQKYIRWALFDADLHCHPRVMPVHAIYSQKTGESTLHALGKLNRRLEKRAKSYLNAAGSSQHSSDRVYPVLYGFFVCGPIVALLTMDSDPERVAGRKDGAGSRFVSQFDLSERGQDVWNSLAIAIMTMYIRKTMIKVKEDAQRGLWRLPNNVPVDVEEDH